MTYDRAKKLLLEAEDRRKKAKETEDIRNSAIVSLSGLIELARHVYGPQYVIMATELLGYLEDLNKGSYPRIFLPSPSVGRPPAHKDETAVLATAVAVIEFFKQPRGNLAAWESKVAGRFGIDRGKLKGFRKKLLSNAPLSSDQIDHKYLGSDSAYRWKNAVIVYQEARISIEESQKSSCEILELLGDMLNRPRIET